MSESTTVVIFGASGDLTRRKLVPALYNLYIKKRLPENFNIVGNSRSKFSHDEWRNRLRDSVIEFSENTFDQTTWEFVFTAIVVCPWQCAGRNRHAPFDGFCPGKRDEQS